MYKKKYFIAHLTGIEFHQPIQTLHTPFLANTKNIAIDFRATNTIAIIKLHTHTNTRQFIIWCMFNAIATADNFQYLIRTGDPSPL